jgi:curved DNA-binding protein CbpA
MRDPYEVLGLAKSASAAEVKSTYRKLAKKFHPDQS